MVSELPLILSSLGVNRFILDSEGLAYGIQTGGNLLGASVLFEYGIINRFGGTALRIVPVP
jgi:hypothetical protein